MTQSEIRRARAAIYGRLLDHLHDLTTFIPQCPAGRWCQERCRRRLARELAALGPELSRLGSSRVAELVAEISDSILEGGRHQSEPVIELALLMAAEVDRELTAQVRGA